MKLWEGTRLWGEGRRPSRPPLKGRARGHGGLWRRGAQRGGREAGEQRILELGRVHLPPHRPPSRSSGGREGGRLLSGAHGFPELHLPTTALSLRDGGGAPLQKKVGTWSLWAGKAVVGRGMGFLSIVYSFLCVNALTYTHTHTHTHSSPRQNKTTQNAHTEDLILLHGYCASLPSCSDFCEVCILPGGLRLQPHLPHPRFLCLP